VVLSSHSGSLYGDGTLVCLDSLVHNDTIVTNGSLLLIGATSNAMVHSLNLALSFSLVHFDDVALLLSLIHSIRLILSLSNGSLI